jgi:hypothetical protein
MTSKITGAVTAQHDFHSATRNGDPLFSVRAGIPLGDAFDQLSLLLSASQAAVEETCRNVSAGSEADSGWAAAHLMEFTYALVQAMHQGLVEHEKHHD